MSSSQLILKTGNAVLDCFDNIYLFIFFFFGFLRKFKKNVLSVSTSMNPHLLPSLL